MRATLNAKLLETPLKYNESIIFYGFLMTIYFNNTFF